MNELWHHGIKGQKWRVRRFQNKDGSYTEAGKRRADREGKRNDVKNRGTLSDAQLRSKINRLKMEKELRELTDQEVNSGRRQVQKILKDVGSRVITTAATGALLYAGKAAVSKSFDPKEFGEAIFNGGAKKKK